MSTGPPSESSASRSQDPPSSTQPMDMSICISQLMEDDRITVTWEMDQSNRWEEMAVNMGFPPSEIIKFKKRAKEDGKLPAEHMLSTWADYGHSVTELYMLLFRLRLFSALDCLKKYVTREYHDLTENLPDFQCLLGNHSSSEKILNGPVESRVTNESYTSSKEPSSAIKFDEKNINRVAKTIPLISYDELKLATDNWNKSNILGCGGFGTVYKGRWKYTDVAIKKIEYKKASQTRASQNEKIQINQSLNELRFLNSCRHDNVLPLYGFSMNGEHPCLVYQYMAGGSVESRLRSKNLTFKQRIRIALGTARGLQYLHTFNDTPLIHGDIKPANILVDPCCIPKIGDFGLVREGPIGSMEVTSIYGTRPYLPEEFLVKRTLSTKVDTYSFGVVLFELFTALRVIDKDRDEGFFLSKFMWRTYEKQSQNIEYMKNFVDEAMDPKEVNLNLFLNMIAMGLRCTIELSAKRPEMVDVLEKLEEIIKKVYTDLD